MGRPIEQCFTACNNFAEMTRLELDSLVEYDMDEEDVSWLKKHGHGTSEDNFELVMDLLEKEAFWMVQKVRSLSVFSIEYLLKQCTEIRQ